MRLRRIPLCLALCAAFGCGPSAADTLPERFLGRWYYVGASGGITGDGPGDAAEGYLVIGLDNAIQRYAENGSPLDRAEFTASLGPTILSTDDQWILRFEDTAPEVVITVSDDGQQMTLVENVYDGFQRSYARGR